MRGTSRTVAVLSLLALAVASVSLSLADTVIPGDMNGDGIVTVDDLPGFMTAWEAAKAGQAWNPAADMDGDGKVTIADAQLMLDAALVDSKYPSGTGLTQADIDQFNNAVADVQAKYQALGGGPGVAQQMVDWAVGQGLAQSGYAAPDGSSYSLLLPSGLSATWPTTATAGSDAATAVQPQDVSQTPPVLSGTAPGAVCLSDQLDYDHNLSANEVAYTLEAHGYRTIVPSDNGTWGPLELPALCTGASVVYIHAHGAYADTTQGVQPCLATPLALAGDLANPKTAGAERRAALCLVGDLAVEPVASGGQSYGAWHYCITPGFAKHWITGLRGALVVINACEVGCKPWYDALNSQSSQVAAAAGLPPGLNGLTAADTALGPALFDFLSGGGHIVDPSTVPPSAVPTSPPGMWVESAFNLSNAVAVENAWFPVGAPTLYSEAVADGDATRMVAYPPGTEWGLVPHLDFIASSGDQCTLQGDFGDANGTVQATDNRTGLWTVSVPIVTRARNSLGVILPAPTTVLLGNRLRYRTPEGLISNTFFNCLVPSEWTLDSESPSGGPWAPVTELGLGNLGLWDANANDTEADTSFTGTFSFSGGVLRMTCTTALVDARTSTWYGYPVPVTLTVPYTFQYCQQGPKLETDITTADGQTLKMLWDYVGSVL